ncbi:MAG: TerB family tellurite resistance protein, partial [Candidatus Hydrogenedentes bacterium]|nr:TerB family tellurite resistance protein [Candidatus Hydrogenedentota bacterium]
MLKKWLDWLAAGPEARDATPEKRLRRALCVLLLEAAAADGELDAEELRHVGGIMRDRFELDQDEVQELLAEAEEARAESVGLFEYTNELNRQFSPEERLRVMEDLWRVIYADGSLDAHE